MCFIAASKLSTILIHNIGARYSDTQSCSVASDASINLIVCLQPRSSTSFSKKSLPNLGKTSFAIFEEGDQLNQTEREILYRPLKRFLDSPLKTKHIRRVARQSIQLISKDFQ